MDRPTRVLWQAEHDPDFLHKPVVCVGGGPSLRGFSFNGLEHLPTIAVNQSIELVPWAKYHLFADRRWFEWNHKLVRSSPAIKVTVGNAIYPPDLEVKRMMRVKDAGLCKEKHELAGIDSGCIAVNLAYHLGASRIILLGYDSGFEHNGTRAYTHFHTKHQVPAVEMYYTDRYGPRLSALAQRLRDEGVPVVRSTPPGRPDIPYVPLPDALTMDPLPPVTGLIQSFIP